MLGVTPCNHLSGKDLVADLGALSYDPGVTDAEFWKRVGEELQRRRMQRGLKSTNAVQTAGGPTYKTVAAIEAGNVGEIGKLNQYLKAVDLSVVDLFRSVLNISPEEHSPDLEFVIRQFTLTGRKGRAAFVQVAELAEERSDQQRPESPGDRGGSRAQTSLAGNAAAKRRGAK